MAKYLYHSCPRCNGYVDIIVREPGCNISLQAVNAFRVALGLTRNRLLLCLNNYPLADQFLSIVTMNLKDRATFDRFSPTCMTGNTRL